MCVAFKHIIINISVCNQLILQFIISSSIYQCVYSLSHISSSIYQINYHFIQLYHLKWVIHTYQYIIIVASHHHSGIISTQQHYIITVASYHHSNIRSSQWHHIITHTQCTIAIHWPSSKGRAFCTLIGNPS